MGNKKTYIVKNVYANTVNGKVDGIVLQGQNEEYKGDTTEQRYLKRVVLSEKTLGEMQVSDIDYKDLSRFIGKRFSITEVIDLL